MHSTLWHSLLAVLVLGVGAAVFGAYQAAEARRKHAEELQIAAASVREFSRQFRSGQIRLELQLEHLIGEVKTKELITRFKHLPEDPKLAQAVCVGLRAELRKAFRHGLEEAWKIPDALRRSGEIRSLLDSPLGSFADAAESEVQRSRLLADEAKHFPREPKTPLPGQMFSQDGAHIFTYSYIPPGEYISPLSGRKKRINYPFWVLQTELTVRQYSTLLVGIPSGNNSGNGRPVRRILWNDLLTACHAAQSHLQNTAVLPPGYIIRPLTEDEWEYCASAGKGICIPDENAWCREKPIKNLPDAGSLPPNALGLHDMLGGVMEMVISDRREHSDSFVVRGGSWKTSRAGLPKARSELAFYQSFIDTLGARLAIAPGSPDMLDRELRFGTPNHLVFNGRHFEFFGHLNAIYTQENAEELCRALGGKLASLDSPELLKKLLRSASPTAKYPVIVGAYLRDGKWVWKNGAPVADPPAVPVGKESFVMENGKFKLRNFPKGLGFICEWSDKEWEFRHRWRSHVTPWRMQTEFTVGDRHFVLLRHCNHAYPHLLRRYAEILGGKLAEPESAADRATIAEKLRDFQSEPTLLGGIRRFRNFYWITSGNPIAGPLPLTGLQPDNAMSLATPAMVNGKLCSVQLASQYLVEFPAGSAAE